MARCKQPRVAPCRARRQDRVPQAASATRAGSAPELEISKRQHIRRPEGCQARGSGDGEGEPQIHSARIRLTGGSMASARSRIAISSNCARHPAREAEHRRVKVDVLPARRVSLDTDTTASSGTNRRVRARDDVGGGMLASSFTASSAGAVGPTRQRIVTGPPRRTLLQRPDFAQAPCFTGR